MIQTGLFLLPLLIAGSYCAPQTLFDIGGTLGYESEINGTIGGALKATRDGLSVNTSGNGIIAASKNSNVIAKGHVQVGEKTIAGDASLKTVIDNSWQPGFESALGRNSKGEWIVGFTPESLLKNKFLLTPNLKVKMGEDAKKLAGLTATPAENGQVPMNFAPGYPTYPNGFYPGVNGAMPNPYGYMAGPNGGQDPSAAYYAQALLQAQYAQALAQAQAQSQMPQLNDQNIRQQWPF